MAVFSLQAQTVSATLKQHAGQQITLTGFDYYSPQELGKTLADSLGFFTLSYPKDYKGMGLLKSQDQSSLLLVLSEETIVIEGTHLKDLASLSFTNSPANTRLEYYAKAQGLYTNALSAWGYLENLYANEALFMELKKVKKTIAEEQERIAEEELRFIDDLDQDSFLAWFIPYRKHLQGLPQIVKEQPERIPESIDYFRSTDFNNPYFKTSGLFKEWVETHYILLQNMGQDLDSVYKEMNLSTQYLIDHLQENESLLNRVSNELFNYFEKHSLFEASEYLSLSLLNNSQCSLDENLAAKLEAYRKLKVGTTAPDIVLNKGKLSELKLNKLLVFGAS